MIVWRCPPFVRKILICPLCSDTVSRSAVFCAITTTIEKCKTEGVVDVFQVVKAMRVQKPGAVHTVVSTHTAMALVCIVAVLICVVMSCNEPVYL